jgi:hypothetical protein
MKKLLIIPLLFFSLILSATKHYVAASGGTFSTITQVNAHAFVAGDSCLFNRGETFYGTLNITWSGSAGSPIFFGAYGTGADPIITGFTTLSSWTDETGGIYSKVVTIESSDSIIVSIDGVNTPIGRFPNTGYNTIDSKSGYVSITDAHLDASVTDWEGADVGIRAAEFLMDRQKITDHTTNTITFNSARGLTAGNGYFIQNDLRTLDVYGEWYYDGSKFSMFFGAVDPATKVVKVSTLTNAVVVNSRDYITFDNISFTGFGSNGFHLIDAAHFIIQNCGISFCGGIGINCENESSGDSHGSLFDSNVISDINNVGIMQKSQWQNSTITNNVISNIGLIPCAVYSAEPYPIQYVGISLFDIYTNTNTLIQYNTISNIGYSGIQFYGTNINVKNNFVNTFCLLLQDGGGIYTYLENPATSQANLIQSNIVINAIGNHEGLDHDMYHNAFGIYVDAFSTGITVENNTIAYIAGYNFFCNGNRNGVIRGNTMYVTPPVAYYAHTYTYNRYGISISDWTNSISVLAGMTIDNNKIVSNGPGNRKWIEYYSAYRDFNTVITSDYNHFGCATGDESYSIRSTPPASYYSLSGWRTYSGQDANSTYMETVDTEIHFIYNASSVTKGYTLSASMVDAANTSYSGYILLQPWSSLILIGTGTVTSVRMLIDPIDPTKHYQLNGKTVYIRR